MKAAIVKGAGMAPVYGEFDAPVRQEGETIVQVAAAALSHLTRMRAAGRHYSVESHFPFVPGVDGVGRLSDGRRVYFAMPRAPYGAMGEQAAVDAARCVALPDDLDDVTAAALANPGMSSWAALRHRARLKPGETVLINGATGTSGRLAVKIARHMGAGKIIATGRNLSVLEALVADEIVPLVADDLEGRFKPHFASGVDVVLDYLWGDSARAILAAGAKAGPDGRAIRFVQIGSMGGGEILMPAAVLRSSSIEMMGSGIGSVSLENLISSIADMFAVAGSAGLDIATRAVPLSDIEHVWKEEEGAERIVFTL